MWRKPTLTASINDRSSEFYRYGHAGIKIRNWNHLYRSKVFKSLKRSKVVWSVHISWESFDFSLSMYIKNSAYFIGGVLIVILIRKGNLKRDDVMHHELFICITVTVRLIITATVTKQWQQNKTVKYIGISLTEFLPLSRNISQEIWK